MTDIYKFVKNEEKRSLLFCFDIIHEWNGRVNKRTNICYRNIRLNIHNIFVIDKNKGERREFNPYYKQDYKHLISNVPVLEKTLELISHQNVNSFFFENEFYEISFNYDDNNQEGEMEIIKK